ncbi:maleylpyruvate isomerase N-terminal domain-containing protein [Haloechinothrix sp. LS1_15]|uniref:maleylpyruvate isomerase N-terminal domain-containing protein n=1 Tax=Haloechinothrix sp. LS1_15 TaxID=2652248 RepID=UPI0029470E9E|nr:maleylpyruvate isomerase N-terminal domain-containing protein [Haloechinothrix sp. LS1_15]MDV6012604.1 maleylpyruvate isomerase family protein [Haloechinothrix sp. LS1_15]
MAAADRAAHTATTPTGAEVLRSAYADVVDTLRGISEEQSWLPTGCTGWTVRDLLFHLLRDAQRALVALASPAGTDPDTDAISYWRSRKPDRDPRQYNLRMTRISASVYSTIGPLLDEFAETSAAAAYAAAVTPARRAVRTQGHVILVEELVRTLIVEAAIHHLDMVVVLDRPGPSAAALRVVRATLDGLLGEPMPLEVDDATYARLGTGRRWLTTEQRHALGPRAHHFPMLS